MNLSSDKFIYIFEISTFRSLVGSISLCVGFTLLNQLYEKVGGDK